MNQAVLYKLIKKAEGTILLKKGVKGLRNSIIVLREGVEGIKDLRDSIIPLREYAEIIKDL